MEININIDGRRHVSFWEDEKTWDGCNSKGNEDKSKEDGKKKEIIKLYYTYLNSLEMMENRLSRSSWHLSLSPTKRRNKSYVIPNNARNTTTIKDKEYFKIDEQTIENRNNNMSYSKQHLNKSPLPMKGMKTNDNTDNDFSNDNDSLQPLVKTIIAFNQASMKHIKKPFDYNRIDNLQKRLKDYSTHQNLPSYSKLSHKAKKTNTLWLHSSNKSKGMYSTNKAINKTDARKITKEYEEVIVPIEINNKTNATLSKNPKPSNGQCNRDTSPIIMPVTEMLIKSKYSAYLSTNRYKNKYGCYDKNKMYINLVKHVLEQGKVNPDINNSNNYKTSH